MFFMGPAGLGGGAERKKKKILEERLTVGMLKMSQLLVHRGL